MRGEKMKKFKIKNIFFLLLMLVGFFVGNNKVNASTYGGGITRGDRIGYYYKNVRGEHELWDYLRWTQRTTDGADVYCIQPFVVVNPDGTYQVTTEDIAQVANISFDRWDRITKVAYYGYGYNANGYNHTDPRWYAATQMLIWRLADPSVDSYFTPYLDGPRDDSILAGEMNEINSLVDNHLSKPVFNDMPSEMVIEDTVSITDSRNVLSNYTVTDVNGGNVSINGNKLNITAHQVGNLSFNLSKLGNIYGESISLYYAIDSQNAIRRGNIDPLRVPMNINVVGGKVTINKTDQDTYTNIPQGEATLEGAIYGVYKEDGTKVGTITTNSEGIVESDYLPNLGKFYVLEETPSTGYQLDKNKYYFDITRDNLYPSIQVFEKVINRDFSFTKVYANEKTGEMSYEKGIKFGIYNNKDEEVKVLTTDNQGNIEFNLPYGTYTVKQLTTTKNYEKIDDFTIEVKEVGEVVRKVLSNAEIKAKLRVIKIDSETKEVIKRAGIKFKIFNIDKNEYVCQTTSYPKQTICEFETDENGEFITPYVLSSGRYKLEEIDQVIDGYLWNSESHEFEIGENSELRTDSEYGIIFDTEFENQRVKGKITINKVGEVVDLTENGYTYTTEPLEGIKFGLFNSENELIDERLTDGDGIIIFEDLNLGKYYIQELETLDGYVLDKTKHLVELNYKDQYTPVIEYQTYITNKVPTGKLIFTKTDFSESETLPNTLIEVYNNKDELVFSGRTDENGKIEIERLPIGKYYILEKEAPEGYTLNEGKMWFAINENGEVVKATMKDEKIVNVPDTFKNKNYTYPIVGCSLILLGSILIVYGKKKRK